MNRSCLWLVDENKDVRLRLFLAFAIGGPLLLLLIHCNLGHQGDMRFFYEWYQTIGASNAFYRNHPGINYPFLGVMAVFGPGWAVEKIMQRPLDFLEYRLVIKLTLVAIEIGLVFAFAGLARVLKISRPRLMAIFLYLLPATWAGGAWFGQLDILGTLFLVLAAIGLIHFAQGVAEHRKVFGWLLLGIFGLQGAVLTKQLVLFSVPGLLLILGLGLIVAWKKQGRGFGMLVSVLAVSSGLLLLLPDIGLTLPDGYFSHLGYVFFGGGSGHVNVLSGNGANLWTLIRQDPSASSLDPIAFNLSAKTWGLLLFVSCQFVLLGWLLKNGRPRALQDPMVATNRIRELLAALILYTGACNLAMATLLTGVHERYLVHGVPFLVLGVSCRTELLEKGVRFVKAGVWVVGFWSGLFVLSSIHWENFGGILSPFRSHTITGCLELALLLGLMLYLLTGGKNTERAKYDGKAAVRWWSPPRAGYAAHKEIGCTMDTRKDLT